MIDFSPLDRPIWNSLTGPHAPLGCRVGMAARYPNDVSPLSGLAAATPQAFADMRIWSQRQVRSHCFLACGRFQFPMVAGPAGPAHRTDGLHGIAGADRRTAARAGRRRRARDARAHGLDRTRTVRPSHAPHGKIYRAAQFRRPADGDGGEDSRSKDLPKSAPSAPIPDSAAKAIRAH